MEAQGKLLIFTIFGHCYFSGVGWVTEKACILRINLCHLSAKVFSRKKNETTKWTMIKVRMENGHQNRGGELVVT